MATGLLSSGVAASPDAASSRSAGADDVDGLEGRAVGHVAHVVLHRHLHHVAARAQLAAVGRAAPGDLHDPRRLPPLHKLARPAATPPVSPPPAARARGGRPPPPPGRPWWGGRGRAPPAPFPSGPFVRQALLGVISRF